MKLKTNIKNRNTVVICVLPIKPVNQSSDFCLFELCESVFKEWFFVYYFPLVILIVIIITTILMSSNATKASAETLPSDTISNPSNRDIELSVRLIRQVVHNQNNPNRRLNYQSFPEDHGGHLTTELRIKLVSILRSSMLAGNYRYGSSIGTIYIANTYRYPEVTPEMAGVVLSAELNPN